MKCSELFGVQFAQGQYVMHCESGQISSIVPKLFTEGEEISVDYEGLGEARGHSHVREFFNWYEELSKKNGGLLRVDMPHTQKITVDADGCHATGEWETMTLRVMGAAFGNDRIQAPLDYAIGRYRNRFALEAGLWKIQSIHWAPVLEFGRWMAKDATKIYGRPYPEPFDELSAVDDATASEAAVDACNIRNQALAFFHDFNHNGITAIDHRFEAAAAAQARKMLVTPQMIEGYEGTVLATSPIISVEKDRARLYLNIGRILPVSSNQIAHSRGRVCAELLRNGEQWRFSEFLWHRYATMEPWPVRSVAAAE